jgi:hypothetical protein
VPGSHDRIVLLKPLVRGHDENLIRVSNAGSLVWRAQLPETDDSWVACRFEDAVLFANSWSCYLVRLEANSGRIISKTITK